MEITSQMIKELREKTGISVMQCKKSLEEAEGDMDKALIILKKKRSEAADKKADREIGAGAVGSYIHNTNEVASLVLLSCETDFVSKNEEFVALANDIAMHTAAMMPEDVAALNEQPFVKNPEITIAKLVEEAILKIGEKIEVADFTRYEA